MKTFTAVLFTLSLTVCVNSYKNIPSSICTLSSKLKFIPKKNLSNRIFGNDVSAAELPQSENLSIIFPSKKADLNRFFFRCSWISWWIQIILSVIAGVILTFANTVRQTAEKGTATMWYSGFVFSSIGVIVSFLNSVWTWNITRISRRITLKKITEGAIFPTLRKCAKISISISLFGMFMTLLGAEQIVGTLASKVLSNQLFSPTMVNVATIAQGVQPLDIFLIQANTNALVAHFSPIVCYIYLLTQLPQIKFKTPAPPPTSSPPSNESPVKPSE